jgi:hypothetical protein
MAHFRQRFTLPERVDLGEPQSGKLWMVVNECDELGANLIPDYLTSVPDGGFYGWPYSYYGRHLDPRVHPQRTPARQARPERRSAIFMIVRSLDRVRPTPVSYGTKHCLLV